MRTRNCILAIFCLAATTFPGHAHANVEFKKSPHGGGERITCSRDGVLVYEFTQKGETRLYEFYWNGKKAMRLLKVGTSATLQTFPMTAVSYTVDLDREGELRGITIDDGNGKVLDGLLRKQDGVLWPADPPPGSGH